MGAMLRVDPARLRVAATADARVGGFVSEMGVGRSLADAAGSVWVYLAAQRVSLPARYRLGREPNR